MFQSGSVLGDRYRLDEPLASGGMAEVWKGHDTILQRAVAIKLLHPHLANDPAVAERFRREAIAAAGLSHPNIVPTFDTGADNNAAFIVMGLVHGPTLREVIDSGDKLSVSKIALIGRQIADALDHAHTRGIVHRDIKPANILLVDGNRVMVTDFGIAKAVEEASGEALTMPGFVVATPGYSAPEQLAGEDTDARTDVYALGVLLHEMSCGHVGTDSPTTELSAFDSSLSGHDCPTLPPELSPTVAKATAVLPDERFQTAADIRDDLTGIERIPMPSPQSLPPRPRPPQQHTVTMPARSQRLAPPRASKRGSKAPRLAIASVLTFLVIAAAAVGRLVGGLDAETPPATPAAPGKPVALEARSFDPFGSNQEHEAEAPRAIDGNGATAWTTESYADRRMGKKGVGLILRSPSAATYSKLEVQSRSQGWSASIYVTNGAPSSFEVWGSPVDTQSGLGETATFDLHNQSGDSVLLWITDLGNARQFAASEVRLLPK